MNKRTIILALVSSIVAVHLGFVAVADAQSYRSAKAAYEAAQESLNDGQYRDAADRFQTVYKEYSDSRYAGDAMYWYAFALYRLGGRSNLRQASDALERQMELYDGTDTENDASALYYRVLGERARSGDEDAARKLEEAKENLGELNDDMDTKMMAMEALLNMNEERALPILKSVMANRSSSSARLREKAVFLLSQHDSDESVAMLIEAAKSDPDPEVREKAIFWISQVESDQALDFLEEIVGTVDDVELRKKAVFAISQHDSERGAEILRRLALDDGTDVEVRENVIFWIGQMEHDVDTQFLKELYGKLDDDRLKEKVLFSVSQNENGDSVRWLLGIARDKSETMEMRKQALFWAGQTDRLDVDELLGLYNGVDEMEFREQVIFVLSQLESRDGIDTMMTLARQEKNMELRKKLIFWIGQSDDPRAVQFLVDIINE